MGHSSRVQTALVHLPEIDPAIAALALWCGYRDSPGRTTTQGDTIHIGPEFPLLPLPEQTGLVAHHILHVALRHSAKRADMALRMGSTFRPDLFDLCCDALVNEVLLQAKHALPRPAVRAAELIGLLPVEAQPSNLLTEWDSTQFYLTMLNHTERQSGSQQNDAESYAQSRSFAPDLKSHETSQSEPDVWAGRIAQAMSAGQSAGTGIGAILVQLGDLPKSMIPWEIRLRRMLNKALSQQPRLSYRRPNRSWLARDALARITGGQQPVFEPGFARDDRRPRLVIGIDTSSSISETALNMFAAEAIAITRRSDAECHLLGFDTEVHTEKCCVRAEAITTLAVRRDGGTDFADVFEKATALDPAMIVMLTDLDAPTSQDPGAKVLWVVPKEPQMPPTFGDVLVMS